MFASKLLFVLCSIFGASAGVAWSPFDEEVDDPTPDCWCSATPTSSQSSGVTLGVVHNTMDQGGCNNETTGNPPTVTCTKKVKRCFRKYHFYVILPTGLTHSRTDPGDGNGWMSCIGGSYHDPEQPIVQESYFPCGVTRTVTMQFFDSAADCSSAADIKATITYGGICGDCGTGTQPPG